jgi:hypothetical protein
MLVTADSALPLTVSGTPAARILQHASVDHLHIMIAAGATTSLLHLQLTAHDKSVSHIGAYLPPEELNKFLNQVITYAIRSVVETLPCLMPSFPCAQVLSKGRALP